VRLFTRNGHDWSGRFPLITEAALRNRKSSLAFLSYSIKLRRARSFNPAFPQLLSDRVTARWE
jgi:hypothetical protein